MLVAMDRRGAGERGPPREYDLFGNLLSVSLPDGRTIEYDVDGAGRRVGRRVLSSTGAELEYRGWIYRDLLRPIAEVDALGNVVARYVYADGDGAKQNGVGQLSTRLGANQDTSLPFVGENVPELIEILGPSGNVAQRLRLIKDQVGTVELVTDASTGGVVQRIEHDEFGRVLSDSDPGFQPFGFAGGLYDSDTGIVRFGARDYDPAIGRWTARDPVKRSGGSENFLTYADNEPISLSDAGGLAVYSCTRWGVGKTSFVRHAYVCVKVGRHTRCYGNGGDDSADVYDLGNCRKIDEDSQCMDRCVEHEIDYGNKDYNFITNNCFDWRERTLSDCRRRCGDY